jgi:hypothetical protein
MKKIPLLPRYFRWIGVVLVFTSFLIYLNGIFSFLPFLSSGLYVETYNLKNVSLIKGEEDFQFSLHAIDLGYLLIILPSLVGLALVAFSKSKIIEDEMISSSRLFSWSWSIIWFLLYNFIIIIFTSYSIYLSFAVVSPHFLFVMFILIFKIQLLKLNRRLAHEE